jgi:hypothetical protein
MEEDEWIRRGWGKERKRRGKGGKKREKQEQNRKMG